MSQTEIYKFSENRKQIINKVVAGNVTTYYIGVIDREDYNSVSDKAVSKWKIVKKVIDNDTNVIEQFVPVIDGVKQLGFTCIWNDVLTYTYL